jgi:hypothetical protein
LFSGTLRNENMGRENQIQLEPPVIFKSGNDLFDFFPNEKIEMLGPVDMDEMRRSSCHKVSFFCPSTIGLKVDSENDIKMILYIGFS